MTKFMKRFRKSEDGATAIEYGLIAALVAIALITALQNLRGGVETLLGGVQTTLENTPTDGGTGSGGNNAPANDPNAPPANPTPSGG